MGVLANVVKPESLPENITEIFPVALSRGIPHRGSQPCLGGPKDCLWRATWARGQTARFFLRAGSLEFKGPQCVA
jgi:hypothetical protein